MVKTNDMNCAHGPSPFRFSDAVARISLCAVGGTAQLVWNLVLSSPGFERLYGRGSGGEFDGDSLQRDSQAVAPHLFIVLYPKTLVLEVQILVDWSTFAAAKVRVHLYAPGLRRRPGVAAPN